jgi:GH35 family endo-1,4-beta-xylanase
VALLIRIASPLDGPQCALLAGSAALILGSAYGYVELALRVARNASPDVLLFINEYGIAESQPKADALLEVRSR